MLVTVSAISIDETGAPVVVLRTYDKENIARVFPERRMDHATAVTLVPAIFHAVPLWVTRPPVPTPAPS